MHATCLRPVVRVLFIKDSRWRKGVCLEVRAECWSAARRAWVRKAPGRETRRVGEGKIMGEMRSIFDLNAAERQRDLTFCGMDLSEPGETRFAFEGAHDPTATRYFVLDQMFGHFRFTADSHLLDVGCGAGRALAYFVQQGFPGKATGVELDPDLAGKALSWASKHANVEVINGSVLDISLESYTDFYLFNPFDSFVLEQFIEKLEAEVRDRVTVAHMSDNGETYYYLVRPGWRRLSEGWIREHEGVSVFSCAQHWTVWEYDPQENV